jgi:hypothetical protein
LIEFSGINELRQRNLRLGRRFVRQQRELRLKALDDSFNDVKSIVPLNRVAQSRANYMNNRQDSPDAHEETSIDRLQQQFLEEGEKAGLIVRLTLMLYHKWRNQEYIVNDLRELTNNSDEASIITLRRLLDNLNRTEPVPVLQRQTIHD